MIEFRKLIVFIFVAVLYIYMIWISLNILNKFNHKKSLSYLMVVGLGLITLGTFFDAISSLTYIKFDALIPTCFTVGAIIFVSYIIMWNNFIVKIMYDLNEYAHNDSMTGVYNRMGFEKVFERKIVMQKSFYVMVFDLDKTKIINDTFGHLKGDQYIINAAKIIRNQIGENGFIGRTGGDEFVAFIENINEEEIENIKFSIKNHVSNIFNTENTQVSIGYSRYEKDGKTFEELLRFADKKMYEDKQKRKEILFNEKKILI